MRMRKARTTHDDSGQTLASTMFANDSGQAMVESALAFSVFLLLIMATIEFGYMFSSKLTLQNAVRQAGRYAITGQCITGSNGTCSITRYNSVLQTLETYSGGLLNSANVGADVTLSCTNQGGGCPNSAGGPGDLVTISVSYPYPFVTPVIAPFFPSHKYTIKVSAAFANEPFPPGQS
jgi:Flp pilus assembly protein TadG